MHFMKTMRVNFCPEVSRRFWCIGRPALLVVDLSVCSGTDYRDLCRRDRTRPLGAFLEESEDREILRRFDDALAQEKDLGNTRQPRS